MKIRERKITIIIVTVALVGLGFLGWRVLRRSSQKQIFTTAEVKKGTIVSTVSASGNLVQTNSFAVTTEVTGVVKDVFVQDGDMVEKGQKLVEITPDQDSEEAKVKAWASYLSTKNAVASAEENKLSLEKGVEDAKGNLIEAEGDFEDDWGSTEFWDAERRKRWSDLKSAELALEIAKQKYEKADDAISKVKADLNSAWISYQLALSTITAPCEGKISDISVAPGTMLSSGTSEDQTGGGQKLLSIVGGQQHLVSISVSEIDIPKITADQKVTLTFDAIPGKTFTGKVVGVDRTGSETQGVVTYPLLIQLDTGEELLYPNMSASAEIIVEAKENVFWVPPQAIKIQAGQTIVRVLVEGKPQEKQVEVGLETSNQAEIINGLSEGETVVVSEITAGEEATFGAGGGMRGIIPGGGGGRFEVHEERR